MNSHRAVPDCSDCVLQFFIKSWKMFKMACIAQVYDASITDKPARGAYYLQLLSSLH